MQPPHLQSVTHQKEYVECPPPISGKSDYFCCLSAEGGPIMLPSL
jgi:hypothetical protein